MCYQLLLAQRPRRAHTISSKLAVIFALLQSYTVRGSVALPASSASNIVSFLLWLAKLFEHVRRKLCNMRIFCAVLASMCMQCHRTSAEQIRILFRILLQERTTSGHGPMKGRRCCASTSATSAACSGTCGLCRLACLAVTVLRRRAVCR